MRLLMNGQLKYWNKRVLTRMPPLSVTLVSLYFFAGSISHFVATDSLVAAMPGYLNYHWQLVIISGVFELMGAIGILKAKTRKIAGYGLMALCIAVLPANVNMALHPESFDVSVTLLYLRLPLQAVLIWFIWWSIKEPKPGVIDQ